MTVEQRAKYDSAMNDEFARLVETNYAREEGMAEGMAEDYCQLYRPFGRGNLSL